MQKFYSIAVGVSSSARNANARLLISARCAHALSLATFVKTNRAMANSKVSLSDKRQLAHDIYMRTDKTQNEIAELVSVGRDTVSDWAKKGKWKELKAANSVTRAQVISNTLLQLKELQDEIMQRPDKKYPTPKESDTMIKMSNLIRDLDKSLSLPDYIMVIEEFLKMLNNIKPALAKEVAPFIMDFAQNKARQISA